MTINKDRWVPACSGTEKPFNVGNYHLCYMWNQVTGEHAYLNLATDIFLTPQEVSEIFP